MECLVGQSEGASGAVVYLSRTLRTYCYSFNMVWSDIKWMRSTDVERICHFAIASWMLTNIPTASWPFIIQMLVLFPVLPLLVPWRNKSVIGARLAVKSGHPNQTCKAMGLPKDSEVDNTEAQVFDTELR